MRVGASEDEAPGEGESGSEAKGSHAIPTVFFAEKQHHHQDDSNQHARRYHHAKGILPQPLSALQACLFAHSLSHLLSQLVSHLVS